jgi:hypothetical protein
MQGPNGYHGMTDLVAAYVLGVAAPWDEERVRAHLSSCASCRELERRLRRVVSQLPLAVQDFVPPAKLRDRILAAAGTYSTWAIPSGWSDELVPLRSHISYHANGDWQRRSLAFLRVGLDAPSELCLLFAAGADHAPLLQVLQEGYPQSVEERIAEGKLALLAPASTGEMVAEFAIRCQEGVDAGFTIIRRLGCYPPAGTPGWPSGVELTDMEVATDQLAASYPAAMVCSYGPDVHTELKEIGLHSHICVEGRTKVNPLYSGACPVTQAES